MVIDYAVSGNAPSDVMRMLDKTAARMDVVVLDVEVIEKSRVAAPEFGTGATG